ncbi:hypothetical protein D6D02_01680 [Aureobasidium pullulans]|nr:hypothetical protein D6D02_01680 [Aureobasidium pullulans]
MSGRLIELNASPWLWIETTWVIIFSALALALRIIVRSHEYGFEDTLLVLAFIFAMASFGCIYQALYDGLGISLQSLLEARTLRIAKLVINSSVLCFIAEGLSKPVGNTSQGSRSGQSSKLRSSNKTRRSLLLTETPPTPFPIIWSSAQAGDRLQDSDSIESHGSQDHIIVKKTDVQVTYSDDGRYRKQESAC